MLWFCFLKFLRDFDTSGFLTIHKGAESSQIQRESGPGVARDGEGTGELVFDDTLVQDEKGSGKWLHNT